MTQRSRATAIVLAVALVSASCSGGGHDTSPPPAALPGGPVANLAGGLTAEQVVSAAASDLAAFWADELPRAAGRRFTPAPTAPQLVQGGDTFRCGHATMTGAELRGNALYCPDSDRLVFDGQHLGPELLGRLGPLAVAAVAAHEYGHAVQRRLGARTAAPVVVELQADCLAGVWLGLLRSRPTASFTATDDQLAIPLLGLIGLRDRLGADPVADDAHGNGFDRLRALLDGIDHGVPSCLAYPTRPPALTGQGFLHDTDRANAGDQPFLPTLSSSVADLNDHYRQVAAASGTLWAAIRLTPQPTGSCEEGQQPDQSNPIITCPDRGVVVAIDQLGGLARLGDAAIAAEVARRWAAAATQLPALGLADTPAVIECLTGYWLGTLHPNAPNRAETRKLRLSPGDLDEAAIAILQHPGRPRPLDRLRAFEDGFTDGLQGCRRL